MLCTNTFIPELKCTEDSRVVSPVQDGSRHENMSETGVDLVLCLSITRKCILVLNKVGLCLKGLHFKSVCVFIVTQV